MEKIFNCSDEQLRRVWRRGRDGGFREPSDGIGDAGRGCSSDVHVMGAIMRQRWAEIKARHTVTSPGTTSLGGLVNKNSSAGGSNGMRPEIELSTGEAVVRGNCWVRLPW